ncbi:MFS transporter [Phytomonospora sp. NPDC050363]|uniref:MFS transporter n=1 Tax=Phytomonospora sp. NPDC050363 TaxID=3155642 RepID=UPI0033D61CD1
MTDALAERSRAPLNIVLASTAVNVFGSAVTVVAVPLLVLHLTGSAFHLGLVGAFEAVGLVAGNTFGGALADRFGARRTAVAGSLSAALVLTLIPLLDRLGPLNVGVLCAIGMVANACGSTGGMARRGLVNQVAEDAGVNVDRAESAYQFLLNAGYVGGLALAGLLAAAVDLATLIWIDAGSFALTALVVACVRYAPKPGVAAAGGSLLRDWLDGLRTAWREPPVRLALLAGCAISGIAAAMGTVVLPLYGVRTGAPEGGLGWLLGASTLGSLLGLGLYTLMVDRVARWKALLACLAAEGVAMLAFVAVPVFGARLAFLALAGLGSGPVVPLVMSLIRRFTPATMHGRVLGLFFAAATGLSPLANLAVGGVLEFAPLWTVPAFQGVVLLALAVPLGLRMRSAMTDLESRQNESGGT